MARPRVTTESQEDRNIRLFNEIYAEVAADITAKHIAKQQEPIIVTLKPYFEDTQIQALFLYDVDAKTDLKMIVPKEYTEVEWNTLMQQFIQAGIISQSFDRPIEPVAFAKFIRLIELNPIDIMNSKYEYFIDFYTQTELDKIVATIESFEILNYAKKAKYQNSLLDLRASNDIKALRALQNQISY